MIAIVDYGMGNIGSIANMLRKVGGKSCITRSPDDMRRADKFILPGVGHFNSGMNNLRSTGCLELLTNEVILNKKPVLGICLGMQLMAKKSEEGNEDGLGWLNAEVRRFNFHDDFLKVPHMGWNTITVKKKNPLITEITEDQRFYFVHSYYIFCNKSENIIAISNHGHDFVSAFQQDHIFGVQFHPEKSHRFGMELFYNFLEL